MRLHLPAVLTPTSEVMAAAARRHGDEVVLVDARTALRHGDGYLYGGPRFAAAVAPRIGAALLEPGDTWLAELPRRFVGRRIRATTLGAVQAEQLPLFVKEPRDKRLPARVYRALQDFPARADVPADTPVLTSTPARFDTEYRLLVLDGRVHDGSRYLRRGVLDEAPLASDPAAGQVLAFADELLADQAERLPSAVVLDVGWIEDPVDAPPGWAVVEANMAWFSAIYACDPAAALDVVRRAAGPEALVSDRDRPFVTSEGPDSVAP